MSPEEALRDAWNQGDTMKRGTVIFRTIQSRTILRGKADLSVVTATYNERDNIRLLIEELNRIFKEKGITGEVFVVDDNSPDGTSDVVLEMQKRYPYTVLIKRPGKMGIGSAYFDGVKASWGEIITLMDADFSQPPAILPQLYDIALQDKIGWGSRYVENVKFESDMPHIVGTKVLNTWISTWLRTGIRDHTLGYFALKRETLNRILEYATQKNISPFDSVLYGLPIAAIALKLGVPIIEVKAPYEQRKHGVSKIGFVDGVGLVLRDMTYTLQLSSRLKR